MVLRFALHVALATSIWLATGTGRAQPRRSSSRALPALALPSADRPRPPRRTAARRDPIQAQTALACRGVGCGAHGVCMAERGRAFCLCDDGFAARGLRCDAVPHQQSRPVRNAGSITREPPRQRIVTIAAAQDRRGPREVGRDLVAYPFALGRYLDRGEWWCTDFVSWVYRAAGLSLSGGAEDGWLIGNNFALRAWFVRHKRWIANGGIDWSAYAPQPGDYLRFHTERGGHSAIVHHVEGDTLYTVEGNVGDRVRLRRYERYKRHRLIDGFGTIAAEPAPSRSRRGAPRVASHSDGSRGG